uniref:Uncharacterized protein n=1 Tax=Arundo donax TaxID=35708 RepID=A0A0A9D4R8_ARUDO
MWGGKLHKVGRELLNKTIKEHNTDSRKLPSQAVIVTFKIFILNTI